MRRRQFIGLIWGAGASLPLRALAQQRERTRHIGVLMHLSADDPEGQSRVAAFLQGLQEAGWAVGRNVSVDVRWAAADIEVMKRAAKELVARQPDLLFTSSTPAAAAMLEATRTIPVVFVLVADPVGTGLIASLPRRGGNMTGFAPIVPSLGGGGQS
ncbi:ABC transporter substrate binding protein [Bradyrhizobium sp. Rc2d]|uniref:ABC transporter substrate binding protein n=1 Tax=Bradyrhizobium sp. Rc2d TaxID=1855321 RepID=UPI000B80EBED|nr:ABC transporter substrate binding protein [Bradyrhizobium sp. Rc2d]